jgi:hypothetical protein
MTRYLCNSCDTDWSDDEDGFCANCRDEVELRRKIDAMDEDTYVKFMAERTTANDNKPLSLATTLTDLNNFFKGIR